LARFWLGSVTDALVRQVNAPLLLLRPDTPPPVVRQILIPLDGSALAERAIEPALALGATLQAEYTLLRIVEPITDAQSAPVLYDLDAARSQPHLAEAHAYLDDLARRLRAAGATVHGLLSVAWKPASAIIEAARERQADLIAMATHGRSGLKRLLLGSVADKVLRGSELPLLLIRPEGSN
jgi:nucleotide-binding universal stress UspA family protein